MHTIYFRPRLHALKQTKPSPWFSPYRLPQTRRGGERRYPTSHRVPILGKELKAYVDASGKGIGVTIGDEWQRWSLGNASEFIPRSPVTNEPNPHWLELLAVYTALQTAVEGGHAGRILLYSDNMTVVAMLNQVSGVHPSLWGTARNPPRVFVDLLKRVGELCEKHGLTVETQWVPTKENPADDPSRGKGLSEDKRLRYGRVISDVGKLRTMVPTVPLLDAVGMPLVHGQLR